MSVMFASTLVTLVICATFRGAYGNDFLLDDMKLNQDQQPPSVEGIFNSAIQGREYRWIDKVMPFEIDSSLKEWTELIENTISHLNRMFCGCFYIR